MMKPLKAIFFLTGCLLSILKTQSQIKNVLPDTARLSPIEEKLFDRQKDNKDFYSRITQFSDLSWVCVPGFDRGSEKGWYILSADISPHFFIGGERMPFAISLTPRYKVRIFRNNEKFKDSSLPVRTPSFMPGLTVYVPLQKTVHNVYKDIDYVTVAAFHHSNGQDGETFLSPMNFNFSNGNFSTNYVEVSFNRNWRNKKPKKDIVFNCDPEPEDCNQCPALFPVGYYDHVFKAGIEQHFGTALDQRGSYSRTRLNLKYTFINVRNWRWLVGEGKVKKQVGRCYLKESDRVILNASVNLDKLTNPYSQFKNRINFEAGLYKRIAAGNTALFLMGGYYGNDPYNIYYSKHYWFLRGGLSLGFFVHTSKIGE